MSKDRTVTLSKHEVVIDLDVVESIWEIAFGADSWEKNYSCEEVIKRLNEFQKQAYRKDDGWTSSQVDAIKHAWMDCMTMAHIDDTDVDLGSLAEGARDSMEELEAEFPFLEGVASYCRRNCI